MARRFLLLCGAALLMGAAPAAAQTTKPVTPKQARAVHEKLITLDTHLDTPANFSLPGWDIMDRHTVDEDGSQLDYPRMVDGGLDGGFFAVYTPSGARTPEGDAAARDAALIRTMEIHQMLAKHGDKFALALTADEAAKIAASGKRFVFISMENSQPMEADLSMMKTFYALGVRMMSPVHFRNNDLGDSATDKVEFKGLSAKGKQFVADANRLGIILDASHASDDVLDQMLALSTTPIILSHSGVRAIYDHPRNVDDARLKALAAKGGVIQMNAYSGYMIASPKNPDRDAAIAAVQKKYGPVRNLTRAQRRAYTAERAAIDVKFPMPKATMDDFMKHLLHAINLVGVDHVGIGLDLDGGGGLKGLDDVADNWVITQRLLEAGYSPADIEKIWSGNALRVMRAVEAAKAPAA